jgi:hypothetical protein
MFMSLFPFEVSPETWQARTLVSTAKGLYSQTARRANQMALRQISSPAPIRKIFRFRAC